MFSENRRRSAKKTVDVALHAAQTNLVGEDQMSFQLLLRHVRSRSSLLSTASEPLKQVTNEMVLAGLVQIARRRGDWLRPIHKWFPPQASPFVQFRSLVKHLFARYRVPNFMASVWLRTQPEAAAWSGLFVHLGRGKSIRQPTIAKKLSLRLIGPEEDWLVKLPFEYRKRDVRLATLGEARKLNEPAFVKPPNDKLFAAQFFKSGRDLPADYDDSMAVLIAEPVKFEVEYRCFALGRTIKTISPYLRHGRLARLDDFVAPDEELQEAADFGQRLLADSSIEIPRAVVLDIGIIAGRGWAVVEANAAWSSGIYGCDPMDVFAVVKHATIPDN